ncbi:helix-turn-helix transcriptional regulator [Microbacterium sp. 2P01SA-2]|uniref:helix-turn-helix domain-containing protein n=1 Tax=unclassified Microbacterium TaxID=2609290 RepID=UPI0039A0A9C4
MPTGRTPEPGPLSRHVANLLATEIARRGLRQTDVAAAAGMSASQLSRVLAAKKVFTIDQLDGVCRAVGIPLAQVVVVPGQQPSRRTRDGSDIPRIDVGPSGDTERAVAKVPQDDRGGDAGDG